MTTNTPQPVARFEIPDAWGEAGRCPACGAGKIKVVHLADLPDYLICEACELSFEVGSPAGGIRIKNVPEMLGFMEGELHGQWISPAELHGFVVNRSALLERAKGARNHAALTDSQVWERILSLHRLGNPPRSIEMSLLQGGVTQAQVAAGLKRLGAWKDVEARQQTRKFFLVGGLAISVLAVFFVGWWIVNQRIAARLEQGLSDPSTGDQSPILPLQWIDALPDEMKPGFLGSPDTRVDPYGPSLSECPASSSSAADLFGGDPSLWSYDPQLQAWQMMNVSGSAVTVRVPAGMHAGYINNQTMLFSTVIGPATISNVSFVALLCD